MNMCLVVGVWENRNRKLCVASNKTWKYDMKKHQSPVVAEIPLTQAACLEHHWLIVWNTQLARKRRNPINDVLLGERFRAGLITVYLVLFSIISGTKVDKAKNIVCRQTNNVNLVSFQGSNMDYQWPGSSHIHRHAVVLSPPARWGSLDFNKAQLLLPLLLPLFCWDVPRHECHIASSGGCGGCLDLNTPYRTPGPDRNIELRRLSRGPGPKLMPERMPDWMTDRIPEHMSERMPEKLQDICHRMPERSERLPGRMSEQLLHFEWSPPWHLYIFLLANLLAFYLTYLLAFYLAYLLTFYLTYRLTFFLAYLLTFCLAYLLTFFLTFFLAFYLAYLLTFYLTSFLTFFPLRSGSAHCDLEVAVEVRQCPLRSGSLRLRSGSAHCDLEVAVEVRQCPLRSATRGWCPAVHTGIWTARRRRRVRRRRRRTALIKSNNPHLAGGEISDKMTE